MISVWFCRGFAPNGLRAPPLKVKFFVRVGVGSIYNKMAGNIKWATPIAAATEIARSNWEREIQETATLFRHWKRQHPAGDKLDWLSYSGAAGIHSSAASRVWNCAQTGLAPPPGIRERCKNRAS